MLFQTTLPTFAGLIPTLNHVSLRNRIDSTDTQTTSVKIAVAAACKHVDETVEHHMDGSDEL